MREQSSIDAHGTYGAILCCASDYGVEIPLNTQDVPDRMMHFRPANLKPCLFLSWGYGCAYCLQNPSLKLSPGPGLLLQTQAEPSNGLEAKENLKS